MIKDYLCSGETSTRPDAQNAATIRLGPEPDKIEPLKQTIYFIIIMWTEVLNTTYLDGYRYMGAVQRKINITPEYLYENGIPA